MVGIRVAIVDDHALVAGAVKELLQNSGAVDVVGIAHTASEGLSLIVAEAPEVALIDLRLPDGLGLDLIRDVRAAGSRTRVLVVTIADDPMTVALAIDLGINGYVLKSSDSVHLVEAVQAAAAGALYLDEPARRAFASWARNPQRLSSWDLEVLHLVQEGHDQEQIARKMSVGKSTLKRHLQTIILKLGAKNTADAANEASRRGLI
jgi:two-component system, NarL family, response regulator DevR